MGVLRWVLALTWTVQGCQLCILEQCIQNQQSKSYHLQRTAGGSSRPPAHTSHPFLPRKWPFSCIKAVITRTDEGK